MKTRFLIPLVAVLLAIGSQLTSAATIAVIENAAPDSTPAATGMVGFQFTLNQDINLTELGFFASSIGGADTPHVSLFDLGTGTPTWVASPTPLYDTGTIATIAGWNYVSVGTPITLLATHTYAVTAPIYFSEQYNSSAGFTEGSALASVTYLKGAGWNGWDNSGYDFTTLANTSPGANLSANFMYDPVPEPSAILLLLGGVGALFTRRRRG